jgi:hypothetical protein
MLRQISKLRITILNLLLSSVKKNSKSVGIPIDSFCPFIRIHLWVMLDHRINSEIVSICFDGH